MGKLVEWIGQWQNMLQLVLTAVISIAAVWYGGASIIKSFKEFKDRQFGNAGKDLGIAIIIFVVAGIGIAGVMALAKVLKPDNAIIPTAMIVPQIDYILSALM